MQINKKRNSFNKFFLLIEKYLAIIIEIGIITIIPPKIKLLSIKNIKGVQINRNHITTCECCLILTTFSRIEKIKFENEINEMINIKIQYR